MTPPLRRRLFTLCADDFGQSASINEAIVELARRDRLGAVSVMSQGPAWPQGAAQLNEGRDTADIGLHLNLTHPFPGAPSVRPLGWWLLATALGRVRRDAVRAAFQSQIDAFVEHAGRLPDYLDGHQHVHAFPVIREVLTEVIANNWQGQPLPWVRAPDCLVDDGGVPLKAAILRGATRGFAAHLQRAGLRHPPRFGGLYALAADANFSSLMRRWLHDLPAGTVLMVHPGKQGADTGDPIGAARVAEYDYLSSDAFEQDAQSADAGFVRFPALPA